MNGEEQLMTTARRSKGIPNFKTDEDVILAAAYVHISTNAATGTDQDAATFWEKIRVEFVRCGGVNTRSGASVQNRFNKVLQADVNKFIGYFHASLREHHSGWLMTDYVADASKRVLLKSVRKAFTMCDDDNEALGKPSGNTNTVDQHVLFVTPRSSVGEMKAKLILHAKKASSSSSISVSTIATRTPSEQVKYPPANDINSNEQHDSIRVLAAAVQAKNAILHERLMFQMFMNNPTEQLSVDSFREMTTRYTEKLAEKRKPSLTSPAVSRESAVAKPNVAQSAASSNKSEKHDDAIDVDNNDDDDSDDDDEYDLGDFCPHNAHLQNTHDFANPKPATDDEEDYNTTYCVATPVAKLPGTQQLLSCLARAQVDAGAVEEENGNESNDEETQLGI